LESSIELNDRSRKNPVLRILRIVAGSILCLLGIVLGPVPIVPGFPLIVLGLALLAHDVPFVRKWADTGKSKWKRWRATRRRRRAAKR
jgi:uncharacterized membrane protein YbaN (DUF454 family)